MANRGGVASQIVTENGNRPSLQPNERRKNSKQRRLPAAVGAKHSEQLSGPDVERYVGQCLPSAVSVRNANGANGERGGTISAWAGRWRGRDGHEHDRLPGLSPPCFRASAVRHRASVLRNILP